MKRYAIGIDPGSEGGIALVEDTGRSGRAKFVSAFRLHGAAPRHWHLRARTAFDAFAHLLEFELSSAAAGDWKRRVPVFIEHIPVTARVRSDGGKFAGDRAGLRTACGIGRFQGLAMAAAFVAGFYTVDLLPVASWTKTLTPLVMPKKLGDGEHRRREAAQLAVGAHDLQTIDMAEAVLIAVAGLFRAAPTGGASSTTQEADASGRG